MATSPKYWVGVVLQRNPVVLPDPTPEEEAYNAYQLQIETEKSKAFNPSVRTRHARRFPLKLTAQSPIVVLLQEERLEEYRADPAAAGRAGAGALY